MSIHKKKTLKGAITIKTMVTKQEKMILTNRQQMITHLLLSCQN